MLPARSSCELFLRSATGYRMSMSLTKAVAQPSLSMGTIRQIPVLVPPFDEQRQIIDEVAEKLSQIEAVRRCHRPLRLARAAHLRQSILKRAFAGQLVPQDTHDEPATGPCWKRIARDSPAEGTRGRDSRRGKAPTAR